MKPVALVFAIIGMASGVLVVLGPWLPGYGNSNFTIPVAFGLLIIATHWFTIRRIRAESGARLGMVLPNFMLLAIILLGVLYLPPNPASEGRLSPGATLLAAVFLLPLASNLFYLTCVTLSLRRARTAR
jgi:hypothetical protein